MNDQFDDRSVEFQKKMPVKERFAGGVFYTPKYIRDVLFQMVDASFPQGGDELHVSPKTILEPTCGSGEFLSDCEKMYPNADVIGVEIDPRSAAIAKSLATNSTVVEHDFMTWSTDKKFDLILGNPPFVVRPTGFVHDPRIVTCRSNLCVEVIYKCITQHLSPDGVLAMVLPASILKSSFYKPTLDLITGTTDVVSMHTFPSSKFMGTSVRVVILVLRPKRKDAVISPYIFEAGETVINQHAAELKKISAGAVSLESLGVKISFGVSAHNVKDFFVDKGAPGSFPLICHKDVVNEGHETQYISSAYPKKRFEGRALLIARGYGHGDYIFKFVDKTLGEFIIENHVIAVTGPAETLDVVSKSFSDERTVKFCKLLCASGDISKTYLRNLPIFKD
ncbi:DNA adenine methyltransferase [Only Syngen Nebraska virus 5]|uniref:DNA adenine methyltransferase n=1 Tax=Only Syngen Nebraska virus 5 TaxID=1917232 RepID=UPI000900FC20|nr:DNA adenine methyltransferase [Only Syngen Nebraska virus 5]APC25642.1 DNA adenine methyltransferase [Only Syngen Nebraska virus 5]